MLDATWQKSPLANALASGRSRVRSANPGVRLAERICGYLNLRAHGTPAFIERVEGLYGLRLPVEPNRFTENNQTVALWLGPDEWLLIVPPGTEHATAQMLRQAGRDHFLAVTDVSHGNTTLRISGPRAADTLSQGCSLDLHPSAFGKNRCAQTLLAKAEVAIRRVEEAKAFDLTVRRSFAEYLLSWLQDAGSDYGVDVL